MLSFMILKILIRNAKLAQVMPLKRWFHCSPYIPFKYLWQQNHGVAIIQYIGVAIPESKIPKILN